MTVGESGRMFCKLRLGSGRIGDTSNRLRAERPASSGPSSFQDNLDLIRNIRKEMCENLGLVG